MDTANLPVGPPNSLKGPINVPDVLLTGGGPSNVSSRVLEALSLPILGHLHKATFQLLDEIKAGLRYVFQTENPWTLVVSGPGHLGMEAAFVNLVEPGDTVLVGVNGLWGVRVADLVSRIGGVAIKLEKPLGEKFTLAEIKDGLQKHRPKIFYLLHAESSTGVLQPLNGIGDLCRSYNCLFILDTVASLGGVPFSADVLKIDVVYTGAHKVLGGPPGLAPITFGPRAVDCIKKRKTPIKSLLLDMNNLTKYWNCDELAETRLYHHTLPINLLYGLREALAELAAETLECSWERHSVASAKLLAGIRDMGLELFVKDASDLPPTFTLINIPYGIHWKHVSQYAMEKYNVEIGGGLGPTVGLVWRIGWMGHNAYPEKMDRVLTAFKEGLEFAKLQKSF